MYPLDGIGRWISCTLPLLATHVPCAHLAILLSLLPLSPYFDGSITQTANGLSASLASSLHAGGQPNDFRPKPREGILKSANPKEPKDTKKRYFGRTRLILSEKGVILAKIEHFRQKFPTTEMHIFAETFRYFYQNQKTFGQKPKERPFV